MLRGATAAGVLSAWNGEGEFGFCRAFWVFPRGARLGERLEFPEILEYCERLREAGIAPLFRASEPVV